MLPVITPARRNGLDPCTFGEPGQSHLPCKLIDILFLLRSLYNAGRLHWNSIERNRGPIEDNLIDDLVEWSMWHYPVIRQ